MKHLQLHKLKVLVVNKMKLSFFHLSHYVLLEKKEKAHSYIFSRYLIFSSLINILVVFSNIFFNLITYE